MSCKHMRGKVTYEAEESVLNTGTFSGQAWSPQKFRETFCSTVICMWRTFEMESPLSHANRVNRTSVSAGLSDEVLRVKLTFNTFLSDLAAQARKHLQLRKFLPLPISEWGKPVFVEEAAGAG